ncbi:hypothetical protein MNBD_UNCLBAC01-313 [hydrothermal vent metagenome]|uniref:Polymerase beta nucleotidyltransferase domain-containing protein n=1 Tax=hydrothermal vent metagenome TaxID=652676 RepID=A0A3B1DAC0_9ZZZZ
MALASQNNKYVQQLKSVVLNTFKNDSVKIVIFGSRARGDQNITSDIDIGLLPKEKIDRNKLINLKEKLEELNIPYHVDLVNLNETEPAFKQEVLKDAVTWKE